MLQPPVEPSHYTSSQLPRLTTDLGLASSMGRTGVCFDNALCESFWSTLRHEFYQRRVWPTRAEARTRVAGWIEAVYNRKRRHSSLGYRRAAEYEQHQQKTIINTQAA